MITREIRIDSDAGASVSGILDLPSDFEPGVTPGLVIAHGQNNDLRLPLLQDVARFLADSGTACALRFNFPYMERGAERPDGVPVLESAFRSAVRTLADGEICRPGPVFWGGKSLGAWMAAQVAASGRGDNGFRPAGLVFLGFPLHAPGRADEPRLEPLRQIAAPCLFVAGTRDPLCSLEVLERVVAELSCKATVYVVQGGDHSFHVPPSLGRTAEDVHTEIAEQVAAFIAKEAGS